MNKSECSEVSAKGRIGSRLWLALLTAAISLPAVYALGFGFFLVTLPPPASGTEAVADGIVALTGGNGRLGAAVALLERGKGERLLITGVNRLTSKSYLKALLHGGRNFDCCADLGFTAVDTRGNAQEAANWARAHHYGSLIVVTTYYHMPRSLVEFGAQMPEVKLVPYPVLADSPPNRFWERAKVLNGEYVKYLASVVRAPFIGASRA